MTTPRSGPFRPGPGKRPPYLAGREAEQALFRDWLNDLSDGVAPRSGVVVHGPRGNGKTTLLHWLEREVDAEPRVDSVWLTPSSFHGEQELVSRLLPKTPWWRLSPGPIANRRPLRGREMETISAVESALTARAKRSSFVLLLDEAHTLTPDIGRILLNASQSVGARLPFLLVLAGTPGLRAVLRLMEASFRNRARAIPVGRLTDEAAREAVLRPFADEGVPITEEALAHILRERRISVLPPTLGTLGLVPGAKGVGAAIGRHSRRCRRRAARLRRAEGDLLPGSLRRDQERTASRTGRGAGGSLFRSAAAR